MVMSPVNDCFLYFGSKRLTRGSVGGTPRPPHRSCQEDQLFEDVRQTVRGLKSTVDTLVVEKILQQNQITNLMRTTVRLIADKENEKHAKSQSGRLKHFKK